MTLILSAHMRGLSTKPKKSFQVTVQTPLRRSAKERKKIVCMLEWKIMNDLGWQKLPFLEFPYDNYFRFFKVFVMQCASIAYLYGGQSSLGYTPLLRMFLFLSLSRYIHILCGHLLFGLSSRRRSDDEHGAIERPGHLLSSSS